MNDQILQNLVNSIKSTRLKYSSRLPNIKDAGAFIEQVLGCIFPHFSNSNYSTDNNMIFAELGAIEKTLLRLLNNDSIECPHPANRVCCDFMAALPEINRRLWLDVEAILDGDPAAKSTDEVILAYPGFLAISIYRVAHQFYKQGVPLLPRLLTEYAHQLTGIDIHPGALIGDHFFIDHGTGIVIGETTIIRDHVKIYQGVTLGALSVEKNLANKKRHPTIEENVVIYSNATILGGETVIGKNSVIGGNVWITNSVAPHSVMYHKGEVTLKNSKQEKQCES